MMRQDDEGAHPFLTFIFLSSLNPLLYPLLLLLLCGWRYTFPYPFFFTQFLLLLKILRNLEFLHSSFYSLNFHTENDTKREIYACSALCWLKEEVGKEVHCILFKNDPDTCDWKRDTTFPWRVEFVKDWETVEKKVSDGLRGKKRSKE